MAEDISPEMASAILAIEQAGRAHDNLTAEQAIELLHSWTLDLSTGWNDALQRSLKDLASGVGRDAVESQAQARRDFEEDHEGPNPAPKPSDQG